MSALRLVIGTRNLSSWSMRPWLVLERIGVPFEEVEIELDRPSTREELRKHSPSGRVPCLHDGALQVWDSLAICEYLNDSFPELGLWPKDKSVRAMARAYAAEMHSGFTALRTNHPMNCKLRVKAQLLPDVRTEVARIAQLWENARAQFQKDGPFLFGAFSIADAMFAPVVSRFVSYGIELPEPASAYVQTWQADSGYRRWMAAA